MSSPPRPGSGPLRVLFDVPRGSWSGNPYIQQLIDHLPADVEVLGYRQETALEGEYDVVHMHWPEHRLAGPDRRTRRERRRTYARWLRRLRKEGIPVIHTRHNRAPHDRKGLVDRRLLRRVPRLISSRIWLTASSMTEAGVTPGTHDVLIPHGSYQPWVATTRPGVVTTRTPSRPVRLLSFGALRSYKNIEETIAAVAASDEFSLLAAGGGRDEAYVAGLVALAGVTANVEVRHGQVPDEELIDLVLDADAVVAAYKDFYNSGVAFLALSLDRPVIVPDGPMTRELRDEFGADWVGLYEAPLTTAGLRRAWESVASHPAAVAWSPERAWPQVSRAHAELYRRLAGR